MMAVPKHERLIERMMPGGILVVGESVVAAAKTFGKKK
jgi:hypothetical protein